MSEKVTLKGVKSGIVLRVPENGDMEELLPQIEEKFRNAAGFFGSKHMMLSIEGRQVTEVEAAQILKLLAENTKVKCEGVVLENKELDEKFMKIMGPDPGHAMELESLKKDRVALEETIETLRAAVDPMNCRVVMGNLRSGANVQTPGSLMVIGDVKPGATVTAGGCIFVLGELSGNADAGAYGDPDAFIFALGMNPIQLRISDAMAIAADEPPKHKKGFFTKKESHVVPEVALIADGHIVITDLDSELMRKNRFYRNKPVKNGTDETAASSDTNTEKPSGSAADNEAAADEEQNVEET